jgi:hypothetical protein
LRSGYVRNTTQHPVISSLSVRRSPAFVRETACLAALPTGRASRRKRNPLRPDERSVSIRPSPQACTGNPIRMETK